MLKLQILLSATLLSAMTLAYASTPQTGQKPAKQPNKLLYLSKKQKSESLRPQAPSRQIISCEYNNEVMVFSFILAEGNCTATITDNGQTQSHSFNSSTLSATIQTGELYEPTITLTTETGNTYTGSFSDEE